MKSHILISIFGLIFLNFFLYLAMEINKFFSYLLLSIISLFCSFIFYKLSILKNRKKDINGKQSSSKILSAEDHPIIKAARKRLGK
jgi:hypothetical protein